MILPDLITPHALAKPESPALIFKERTTTYGELNDLILRCAQGLVDLGIKKGNAFGIVLRNCPEFIVLSMALAKIGAVSVPINFLEKPDRLKLILNDAKAVGILTSKEFYPGVRNAAKEVRSLKYIFLREGILEGTRAYDDLIKKNPWTGPFTVKEDDLMMLLYTSGTTGLPKGVMLTHKNFIANIQQSLGAIKVTEKDRFICLLPMFHSFSWTVCVLIPLYIGTWCLIIESLLPFEPIIKSIWNYEITVFVAVPQIFSALAAKIRGAKTLVVRLLNPVRIAICGAGPLPPHVHRSFERKVGVSLLEGYGLTEASPVVSLNPLHKRKIGTVGLPLPGVIVEIRDEEGRPVNQGDMGEIWIKGENVMKGYFQKPQETQEALTKDGWLKSGDLGLIDREGYITIVDRKKDLIIVKGLNVYPKEIENLIAEMPHVKEVAVVGKPDPETGDELIRAFLVAKDGESINKNEILEGCREHLAPYKRPKDIIVVKELPKNALQKILKKELRKL